MMHNYVGGYTVPTAEELGNLFAGKKVRITHTNSLVGDFEGICRGIRQSFEMVLEDGRVVGFVPDIITSNSTDGKLPALAGGRRKIEVI